MQLSLLGDETGNPRSVADVTGSIPDVSGFGSGACSVSLHPQHPEYCGSPRSGDSCDEAGIGESLPLFADRSSESFIGDAANVELCQSRKGKGYGHGADADASSASQLAEAERHMQAAWRLSNALRGRSAGAAKVRRLKPQQKHQLGSIICGHLLASLRAQADLERRQQAH